MSRLLSNVNATSVENGGPCNRCTATIMNSRGWDRRAYMNDGELAFRTYVRTFPRESDDFLAGVVLVAQRQHR